MDIGWVWREERPIAFALTGTQATVRVDPPIVLWRKQPPESATRFLLDAKKSHTIYPLSELGRLYLDSVAEMVLPLRYVVSLDRSVQVPATYEVFSALCAEGWLSLWHPVAPLSYFAGRSTATLILVQTTRLQVEADAHILERERNAGNFYCALTKSFSAVGGESVVPLSRYMDRRTKFLGLLSEHGWLLSEEAASSSTEDTESLF